MRDTRSLARLLWGVVLLGLLFYLGLTLWLALAGIFFPYQLDYGEGIVLWFTHELALGYSIYKGLEGLPLASSNYPPLAMLLAVPFRALFGDSYTGGRLLNLASALIVATLIFRIVWSGLSGLAGRARHFIAALAALFFLGSTFVYHWIPLFRIDLIGLAFTVAGVYMVWRWEQARLSPLASRPTLYLIIAGLLFLCALYTKHSLFLAPASAAGAIFLKDRRAAVIWAGGLGLAGAFVFVLLDVWTQGGFLFGILTSNATVWLWSTFWTLTREFAVTYLVLILLAAWGWVDHIRTRRIGILEIYAVAAAGSLLLAGRVGAWQNYYFEAIVVVCILAAMAMAHLLTRIPSARFWLPVLLLFQLWLFWDQHDPRIAQQLMELQRQGNQAVGPLVKDTSGTLISEDMGLLVTNGKPVEYYTFQYSSLARAGTWDQHWEMDNLRQGNFPLVILNKGTREDVDHFRNFTREFMSALDYGYALGRERGNYQVYAPAPLDHLGPVNFDSKIELVGWVWNGERPLLPGRVLAVPIVWRAETRLATEYTAFVHLEDEKGTVIAQDDHAPRVGLESPSPYPTTRWAAGEMFRDTYLLRIPANIKPGTYSVRAGWYESDGGDRLSINGSDDFFELGKFVVRP